jgi:hypothetical protein
VPLSTLASNEEDKQSQEKDLTAIGINTRVFIGEKKVAA